MQKVVMISGASRGIGLAIARELARRGYRLSLGVRDPALLANEFDAFVCPYEARDPEAGRRWVAATVEAFGRIDVLISNAGICKSISLEDGTDEMLEETLDINVKAPFRLIQAALPHLRRAGDARVVQIASLSGKRVKNLNAGYQMSKHAVIALNHAVRRAGWDDGIRATAICPGFVNTEMAAGIADLPPDAMTQPEDLARIVANTIELPNSASVAEILVNCRHEDLF
ncbi:MULTISPECIES: SDR family NAD(P)-dependent oxidoreductase [Paraburkholderia]|uniref:NAD(P)-dependent dehydrogenase (Short-subunit alcohol dehydrogenase family) n=2 Tax=Paraburkholderia TaxID=1822464 RepID=A0A7Z0B530_9BURK|nr:SDR family NAD(P)-dependent oxidoreductase [Paraburkholderia bryophila]NYH19173.1 NAD(P)-dependent dehydrogenase (short-subunit alcohol dehydrogenase family) [Paraburkholderia bryophila]NYH21861.1 NAD(P)-dependent dehydrogenase (short-subunit alcohol dehydrogenase family) [Paraburkholderia bryophila]